MATALRNAQSAIKISRQLFDVYRQANLSIPANALVKGSQDARHNHWLVGPGATLKVDRGVKNLLRRRNSQVSIWGELQLECGNLEIRPGSRLTCRNIWNLPNFNPQICKLTMATSLVRIQADWSTRATELGRVANAAVRSTSRRAPQPFLSVSSRCKHTPSTSLVSSFQNLGLNGSQMRFASGWTAPRSGKADYGDESNITKPKTTISPQAFRSAKPEIPDPDTTKPEPTIDNEDMVRDVSFGLGDLSNSKYWSEDRAQMTAKYPEIRCVARTGRTIQVMKGTDPTRAFKMLQMSVTGNRVRQDERQQKFHERPGLKRKRLNSERWRRRFKKAFKSTCARVEELRRQGW
jgi:ribosomal protein S21